MRFRQPAFGLGAAASLGSSHNGRHYDMLVMSTSAMAMSTVARAAYPIGTAGKPWGSSEKAEWLATRKIARAYKDEVLDKLDTLTDRFVVTQYGSLSHDPDRYPLFSVRSSNWSADKPCVLVTGGVHGYETSGVQGAILFLQTKAEAYSETFNIIVVPCVSPWGYETIQRWNAQAVDPNRSFNPCARRLSNLRTRHTLPAVSPHAPCGLATRSLRSPAPCGRRSAPPAPCPDSSDV